ncbi:MAG TPA: ABC transporter permease, partial [Burkholderiaceae bacterium]|nr:ABC transporter permease [Burkholderiaceae bacterium]
MPEAAEREQSDAPAARFVSPSAGSSVLHLSGAWRLVFMERISAQLAALQWPAKFSIDGSEITEIDSAGALALLESVDTRSGSPAQLTGFAENELRIVEQVRQRLDAAHAPTEHHREGMLETIGRRTIEVGHGVLGDVNFLGETVVGVARSLLHPHTVRVRELTAQFEQVCLNAIPVVALVTLLIGVVVAYLLGLQAEQFGANIFVVDGVGIGTTREFAPIIVAVIVAGRSGAAFTAQLGSMRLTEETDAIRTLGLSPLDVLVLPRVIALMIAMPLLVFVGDVMSLVGAMLIAHPMLDVTPTTFVARLRDTLDIAHPLVGLAKAPVFALVIAVIGCRMGMSVER